MLTTTEGLVLRSIKYGDSSLIVTIFMPYLGVKSFLVQGVRSAKNKKHNAGYLQPSTLLEIVLYHQPQKTLQRLREFTPSVIYHTIQENVVKTSIALFCTELLLRLLPPDAIALDIFDFVRTFFVALDQTSTADCGNLPIYFAVMCSRHMGYEIIGDYTDETPYLDIREGGYSSNAPSLPPYLSPNECKALAAILKAEKTEEATHEAMNGVMRNNILEWYIQFLHSHTQHMGTINSLQVLKSIFH